MAVIVSGFADRKDTVLYSGNAGCPFETRIAHDEMCIKTIKDHAVIYESHNEIALQWKAIPQVGKSATRFGAELAVRLAYSSQTSSNMRVNSGENKNAMVVDAGEQQEDWNIRAVFCGDDSTAPCGRMFRSGAYYATGSLTSGKQTYNEIDGDSLVLCDQGAKRLEWQWIPILLRSCSIVISYHCYCLTHYPHF
eukprot:IDg21991t1